jgi:hypothetical protein
MTTPLKSSDDEPSGTTRRPGTPLVPCGKISHADLHRPGYVCPQGHAHGHILTSSRGQVRWFDDEHVHIIDSCGIRGPHDENDTPILWYVAAAPGATSSAVCPNNIPYAPPNGTPPPYGTGVPNPNIQIPRTWPGNNVQYVINIPGGSYMTDIFQGLAGFTIPYTYNTWRMDVEAIMASVAALPTVNMTVSTPPTYSSTDYEPVITPTPTTPVSIMTALGDFTWDTNPNPNCAIAGPTGDGVNEFIFLRRYTDYALGPGLGISGGLTSMIVKTSNGLIAECDVIWETGGPVNAPVLWGGTPPIFPPGLHPSQRASTGLPHEIGHFFGLDHSTLHLGGLNRNPPAIFLPGGVVPAPPSQGIFYAPGDLVPAMSSVFTPGGVGTPPANPVNRVLSQPWARDDIVGLSSLYPVTAGISVGTTKAPLDNSTATIQGIVKGATYIFGMNVYVIPRPPTTPFGSLPPPGAPPTGTLSGLARLSPFSVVGAQDTMTGAICSGEFLIAGIPANPSPAAPLEYDVFVEPLESIALTNTNFAEWFVDPVINPLLNFYNPPALGVALLSNRGAGGPLGPLCVGSIEVRPGTVITLSSPINLGSGNMSENVSRPVVDIAVTNPPAFVTSTTLFTTVTVEHNSATLANITATVNGAPQTLTQIGTTTCSSCGGAPSRCTSTYTLSMTGVTFPATVTVTAFESPFGFPMVPGTTTVTF